MSGHSKWSKVKHQKAVTDATKAADFTRASRGLALAVKNGGGMTDPEKNFRLRLAIEKAKEVNMPKDTIDRAIERAAGGSGGDLHEFVYEAIGLEGICCLIVAVTDNKARTVSLIKNILGKHSYHLAAPGSVMYQFRIGQGNEFVAVYPVDATDIVRSSAVRVTDSLLELDDVQAVYMNV